MQTLVAILLSVFGVSLIAFVGVVFVGINEEVLNRIIMTLVGFSSGALMGGAFLHLLPESVVHGGEFTFQYAVMGILLFFILEKFLHWRHCHMRHCPVHAFAYLNIIGDGIHNFIDGMLIAASFVISPSLGVTTTIAVVAHEVPQEIGDFGVLIYAGLDKKRALFYNFLSALTAVAGALATYHLTTFMEGTTQVLVPLTAGGFIYIAGTDLMPELHKRTKAWESITQFAAILAGLALMLLLKIR